MAHTVQGKSPMGVSGPICDVAQGHFSILEPQHQLREAMDHASFRRSSNGHGRSFYPETVTLLRQVFFAQEQPGLAVFFPQSGPLGEHRETLPGEGARIAAQSFRQPEDALLWKHRGSLPS